MAYERLASTFLPVEGVKTSFSKGSQLIGTSRKRRVIFGSTLLFVVVLIYLATSRQLHLKFKPEPEPEITEVKVSKLGFGPPTYERLRQWEDELPQHNLDLPFPEGRTGRYVHFQNQIRQLGWNNVFNDLCVVELNPLIVLMLTRPYTQVDERTSRVRIEARVCFRRLYLAAWWVKSLCFLNA